MHAPPEVFVTQTLAQVLAKFSNLSKVTSPASSRSRTNLRPEISHPCKLFQVIYIPYQIDFNLTVLTHQITLNHRVVYNELSERKGKNSSILGEAFIFFCLFVCSDGTMVTIAMET